MILFDISDIRLFWNENPRFLSQFDEKMIKKFIPYSKYPGCIKDVSFWCNSNFEENTFCDLIREEAGDLVESVKLVFKI